MQRPLSPSQSEVLTRIEQAVATLTRDGEMFPGSLDLDRTSENLFHLILKLQSPEQIVQIPDTDFYQIVRDIAIVATLGDR